MKTKLIPQILMILSIIGVVLAIYLLYEYLAPTSSGLCTINGTVNCEAVTKGNLAEVFGVPVSLVGLVGYIVIFLSAFFKNKKMAVGMTAFGMLFCLRLTILEIFVEHVLCPVCMACQSIMLVVFLLSLVWLKQKDTETI